MRKRPFGTSIDIGNIHLLNFYEFFEEKAFLFDGRRAHEVPVCIIIIKLFIMLTIDLLLIICSLYVQIVRKAMTQKKG